MKRRVIGTVIVCAMAIALPSAAQQKLGDVAGSIKLKKTGSESVVINDSGLGHTSQRSTPASDTDLLYSVLEDCLNTAQGLSSFLDEAPRIMPVVYSDSFRDQLDTIDRELENMAAELRMLPEAGPYESAYLKAVGGMEQVQEAFEAATEAVNSYRLVSSVTKRQLSGGVEAIEVAMTDVRSVGRAQAAAAPAAAIDPIAAAASIKRLCSRLGAEGSPAYVSCVQDQDAAKNALVGRTAPAVGLDASTFNKTRNTCAAEWPDNYVNRDACERRRAAAGSGG